MSHMYETLHTAVADNARAGRVRVLKSSCDLRTDNGGADDKGRHSY